MERIPKIFPIIAALLLSAPARAAEPVAGLPTESPTESSEAIDQFVASFATSTRMTGKIARWEAGICPLAVGQQPALVQYVMQRVKDVAAMVGAPVNPSKSCTPNIEIVFTRVPQELLNSVRTRQADFLGYAENQAELDRLATITRPLQAWYETQTQDRKGMNRVDSARRPGEGVTLACFACGQRGQAPTEYLPYATYAGVTGYRINDGVRSTFRHVTIVADVVKLTGYEAGPLADYIAMLALTQLNSLDVCQPLPSIENMLAKGCESKNGALTRNDIAYLGGLYKMDLERLRFTSQRNDIANSMKQALAGATR